MLAACLLCNEDHYQCDSKERILLCKLPPLLLIQTCWSALWIHVLVDYPACTEDHYQCESKECILLSQKCDGNRDCLHGDDERLDECSESGILHDFKLFYYFSLLQQANVLYMSDRK